MSFRIPRQDIELRFVIKFGENRPLRSFRKVAWITTQTNWRSAGLVPASILPKMGGSPPTFPERCQPECLVLYRWFTRPTVIRPGTNRAYRRVTTLIKSN